MKRSGKLLSLLALATVVAIGLSISLFAFPRLYKASVALEIRHSNTAHSQLTPHFDLPKPLQEHLDRHVYSWSGRYVRNTDLYELFLFDPDPTRATAAMNFAATTLQQQERLRFREKMAGVVDPPNYCFVGAIWERVVPETPVPRDRRFLFALGASILIAFSSGLCLFVSHRSAREVSPENADPQL